MSGLDPTTWLGGPAPLCPHDKQKCSICAQETDGQAYRRGKADADRAHEQWKKEATEAAHDWANENSLCSVFDDFMVSIGLNGRMKDWEVHVRVRFDVAITMEAHSARDAEQNLTSDDVAQALREAIDNDHLEWSVQEVEEG